MTIKYSKRAAQVWTTLVFVLFGICLAGCDRPKSAKQTAYATLEGLNDLMRDYSKAEDAPHARSHLKAAEYLLEHTEGLDPYAHATGLAEVYARLYLLERRLGKDDVADAEYVKAGYWLLQSAKLANVPDAKAVKEWAGFIDRVISTDLSNTDGQGPAYLSNLPAGAELIHPSSRSAGPATSPEVQ